MTIWSNGLTRRSFLKGLAGASALALPRAVRASELSPTLSLLPFLARPTTESILVNARNGHMDAMVQLRVRPLGEMRWMPHGPELDVRAGEFVNWSVDGLDGGRAYEYQVRTAVPGAELGPVAQGRFTTQRSGEVSFDAALITDAHTGAFTDGTGPIEVLDEVIRNVRRDRPDFVIALGDNVA